MIFLLFLDFGDWDKSLFQFDRSLIVIRAGKLRVEVLRLGTVMVDVAEKSINDLRQTVSLLELDFERLNQSPPSIADYEQKVRTLSEVVTQTLVRVDSVEISKDGAADALRNGDRQTSRKLAVLLSRRKAIVKRLNTLADNVDNLLSAVPESSRTHAAETEFPDAQ